MSKDSRRDHPQQSDVQQPQMGPQYQQPQNQQQSIYDRVVGGASLEEAVIFGLIAAVSVFAIVATLAMVDPGGSQSEDDTNIQLEEEPGWLDKRGWLFFSTHFVETTADVTTDAGQQVSQSVDLLEEADNSIPSVVYRLVPVGVLTVFGYLYTLRNVEATATLQDGARTGALLVAGYLPAIVAGVLLFSHRTDYQTGSVTYEIPFSPAVPIAGVIYPLLFGALGGYLLVRTN